MKPTRKLLNSLQYGDVVLIKTKGQLIDYGYYPIDVEHLEKKGIPFGQILFVENVVVNEYGNPIITVQNDENTYLISMIQEAYILSRDYDEDDYDDDYDEYDVGYEEGYEEGFNCGVEHVLEHLKQHWEVWLDEIVPYLKR